MCTYLSGRSVKIADLFIQQWILNSQQSRINRVMVSVTCVQEFFLGREWGGGGGRSAETTAGLYRKYPKNKPMRILPVPWTNWYATAVYPACAKTQTIDDTIFTDIFATYGILAASIKAVRNKLGTSCHIFDLWATSFRLNHSGKA